MIPGSANPLLLATAAAGGYTISRSLRFNSADSAYLSRTPASAGNRKTWIWAGWVKRSRIGADDYLFAGPNSTTDTALIRFTSGNVLRFYTRVGSSDYINETIAVYRDLAAWMHIVVTVDTTQASAANRVKLYVNGTEAPLSATPTIPQNSDTYINGASIHYIGALPAVSGYCSAYLADIHFIDGQALDPTSFGEFSATTGVWMPKAFSGSYGTNGFKLDFADNSAATAAALGKDTSGNGNNFTPTNLSVTAGAGNDSLIDVPVNGSQTDTGVGGEVRGNYCTLNPLDAVATGTKTNGNLDLTSSHGMGTFFIDSGKWYYEFTPSAVGQWVGWSRYNYASNAANITAYRSDGTQFNGSSWVAYGATYAVNDVIGIAIDRTANTVQYFKNGVSQGVISRTLSGLTAPICFDPGVANFGQRPFAYTAPSGFKALCTANLPAPTIVKPSTVMDVVLYTGTGSTLTPTSSLGFSPDLVWIKSRSAATDNTLYDAVRGAQARLESNNTDAEVTSDNGLTAFNSAGFTLGTLAQVNTSSATYAAWTWDAGSSTVTNTAGTITSSVRANASAGFSVVTYTGTGSTNASIGHGLGVAPQFIITKRRDTTNNWLTWHGTFAANDYIALNLTSAKNYGGGGTTTFGGSSSSLPTSTVFYVGADLNPSTATMVAYCFAPVAGYSAFGSYTGNGSADGPFVFCNFRPRWVMVKETTTGAATSHWVIKDNSRPNYNATSGNLYANLSNAEDSISTVDIDITSNGFKIRGTYGGINTNNSTHVYAAFAESPFQYSRAR